MNYSTGSELSLQKQILKECIAMAKYAFRTGLQVPPELANSLNAFGSESSSFQTDGQTETDESTSSSGITSSFDSDISLKQLALIHNQLSQLILPAKPQSILLLDQEAKSKSKLKFLGPIPLVRYMMAISIFFLVLIIAVSLSPEVTDININRDWFKEGMSGMILLVNLLFLLSASGLGASFAALFELNKYIVDGTYDPKYIPSYWIRFVLGLIAGIMLAELIPDFSKDSTLYTLGKPTLAMLGGFSASLVYRILNRLVTAVETLVRGDNKQLIETQEVESRNRANQEISQSRLKLASDLVKLKQQLGEALSPEEMNELVNGMLNKVLPFTTSEEVSEKKSTA